MRWTLLSQPDPVQVDALAQSLKVPSVVASLLLQRGVTSFDEAKLFFRPQLADLHDPFLMKDMDLAVARISRAINEKERILVFGDYDVDGTTAVALVSSYLKTIHSQVETYIPDRYTEGYGISNQGIDYAAATNCSLIIALDCGIKSIAHVAYAKSLGIDFIICDHHRPGDKLPDAVAVLDPKRLDCAYPYDELCGCGIGFKLVQALTHYLEDKTTQLLPYLDLVATAIGADIVPITGENRVLAYFGMQIINSVPRPGLKALFAEKKAGKMTISDVVFTVAPRINAAGRMKHGKEAVALLLSEDYTAAKAFAQQIEQYNSTRKLTDKVITEEALNQIIDNDETARYTTVVYQENWHKGVLGIVASRLVEKYYRPTLVFTKNEEKLAASARSVRGFDIYQALESCATHLEQFGGHMYAAGLTLKPENYGAFKEAFEQVVANTITPDQSSPEIEIDYVLDLQEITPKLRRLLAQFEPSGPGNMSPVFLTRKVVDTGYAKYLGNENQHLRLFIKQRDEGVAAVGFGLGTKLPLTQNRKAIDVVYSVEENEWNGQTTLQLNLKDLKPSDEEI